MKKRYAIVRVDNVCPLITEEKFYCFEDLQKDKCKKCIEIYGDTKEQLIRKVETAITIWCNKGFYNKEHLARKIVEFLGVEDER